MSEPENFIARWSRRKRKAAQDADATKAAVAPAPPAESEHPDQGRRKETDAAAADGGALQPSEAAFDPTTLPPIETITAESDIRAFLAPGVPPELTRAALRRAWATDPKIRDFVGRFRHSRSYPKYRANRPALRCQQTQPLRSQQKTFRAARCRTLESTVSLTAPYRNAAKQLLRRSAIRKTAITIN